MATWARTNRKMIEKSGTKKQRAILAQLDKGTGPVKSGAQYARSITKGKSAPLPKAARKPKTAAKKPVDKPQSKVDGSVTAKGRKTKFKIAQDVLTEQLMTSEELNEYLKLRGASRR